MRLLSSLVWLGCLCLAASSASQPQQEHGHEHEPQCVRPGEDAAGSVGPDGPAAVFSPCGLAPLTTYEARVSFSGAALTALAVTPGGARGGAGRTLLDVDKTVFASDAQGRPPPTHRRLEVGPARDQPPPRTDRAGVRDAAVRFVLTLEPLAFGAVPHGVARLVVCAAAALALVCALAATPLFAALSPAAAEGERRRRLRRAE